MGKIKESFLGHIFEKYPELKSLELELQGDTINFSDLNYLLPYLAFTNSLDKENRLINFFHPPFSDHHIMIPFYIALAVFKKEVDKMRGTLQPIENGLVVLYRGDKLRLDSIDFENERVRFRYSTKTGYLSFEELMGPLVRPYSRKQKEKLAEIRLLIEEYQIVHSNSIQKLLDTPKVLKKPLESGVIIFATKGKFKTIFQSLKVSGVRIDDKILAYEAIYERDSNSHRYEAINELSLSKYSSNSVKRPFILLASYMDINLIDKFRSKFPHLDTVIFDEAEDKLDKIDGVLPDIKRKLKSDEGHSLRDIYLLTSDTSIHTYYDLNKGGDPPYHWIATPKDMSQDNMKGHGLYLIKDEDVTSLLKDAENLRRQIGSLYSTFPFEAVAPLFNDLQEVIIRYYSVYESEDFNKSLESLKSTFKEFASAYLDERFDRDLIQEFDEVTNRFLDSEESAKLNFFKQKKDELLNPDISSIGFVLRNDCEEDLNQLTELFRDSNIDIEFIDFDESLKSVREKEHDLLIFFEIRKPYINSLFMHELPGDIYLFLTEHEYGYYRKSFYRVPKILNWISKQEKRGKLLNLSDRERDRYIDTNDLYQLNISDYVINHEVLTDQVENVDFDESDFTEDEKDILYGKSERDIEDLIIGNIENQTGAYQGNNGNGKISEEDREQILIIFEDKTFVKVHSTKKYYRVTDDEVRDIEDLEVEANSLQEGDDLLLFHIDHDDLLNLLLNKMKFSDRFRPIYEKSEVWRKNVKILCAQVGYKRASELLSNYISRTPLTLENWCKGNTLAPNQHRKVIKGLNRICETQDIKGMELMYDVDEIKNASSTVKGLLLSLPRKLKERSLRKLYGLKSDSSDSEEILIDQILEDVDIKTVNYVLNN